MARARLRELGISLGVMAPGPLNAITDVEGVTVGYATLMADRPRVLRTGVTAIWPRGPRSWTEAVFAGSFSFNGNGEMTGLAWIAEQGMLASPIGITSTHSVGVVRDAICQLAIRDAGFGSWSLPVVAETWDGTLSDPGAFAISTDFAISAFDAATSGVVAEGNVGGGAGMICHEFKGGSGTSSRIAETASGRWTVGAFVQANYGRRPMLRVDGVPVGREIGLDVVPSPFGAPLDAGSIIVVLATDAPLLPIQCQRLAKRATTGLAWAGGYGANSSGDIFLAFSTGNALGMATKMTTVQMMAPEEMSPLFQAAAEATEEAVLNAMTAAETMTGLNGRTAHALPLDQLQAVMRRYRPEK